MSIQVDPWSDAPVYLQIVDQVRVQVASGALRPGDRLEPVRQLAHRLGLNAGTVARAYQVLEHEGVIQTNRRGGSTVAGGQDMARLRQLRQSRLRALAERYLVEALAQGCAPEEVEAAFELQLAAWRERRQPAGEAAGPAGELRSDGLRFAGSHDLALELLWAQARQREAGLSVAASYVGSLDGLLALLHGDADLAGAHILDEESGDYNLPILRRLFLGQELCVVTVAEREQGLLVPPGNPRALRSLADLQQPGPRFVNRQPGSGTRTLLDYRLRQEGVAPASIRGYEVAVTTHLAVAAAVAEGRADAGLGLFAAARAYNLDFVPLAHERYDLILPAAARAHPPLAAVLEVLASPGFRATVAELGGYDTTHTGEQTLV